jgi:hypothetical protein
MVNIEAVCLPEWGNSCLSEFYAIVHAAPTEDSTQLEDKGMDDLLARTCTLHEVTSNLVHRPTRPTTD